MATAPQTEARTEPPAPDAASAPAASPTAEPTVPRRIRWTVDQYYRMAEAGILGEDSRVELIEGDVVVMGPIGPRHADVVDRLTEWFVTRVAGRATVRVQNPLHVDDRCEPEPDLMLVRRREGGYATGHPRPEDVLLLVEVRDTSAPYDRRGKLDLYARSGIPEVWLFDLAGDRVEAHRGLADGTYTVRLLIGRGQSIAPEAMPDVALDVGAILG